MLDLGQPVKIGPSGVARVRVAFPLPRAFENVTVELDAPPDGMSIGSVTLAQNGAEFEIRADPTKVAAGLRGNLIATISGERAPQNGQAPAATARRRVTLATLPAIRFEVAR